MLEAEATLLFSPSALAAAGGDPAMLTPVPLPAGHGSALFPAHSQGSQAGQNQADLSRSLAGAILPPGAKTLPCKTTIASQKIDSSVLFPCPQKHFFFHKIQMLF